MKDILSVLTKLSLSFQSQQLDISLVQSNVTAAIHALESMKNHDGPHLAKAYDSALYNITDSASQRSTVE